MPTKSAKDTNAPRKPLSAYILFSADERPKLKASGLDNFAEMSKALGAAWKKADDKTKAYYEKEHEREKTRYENELKEYEKSGQPAPSSKSAQKNHPPSNTKPTKSATTKSTAKKNAPAVKNAQPASDEENDDEEEGDDDDEASEEEESEQEEETPAPPVKSSRKKI